MPICNRCGKELPCNCEAFEEGYYQEYVRGQFEYNPEDTEPKERDSIDPFDENPGFDSYDDDIDIYGDDFDLFENY